MWLFFATVLLAAVAWAISYNYHSYASELSKQKEAFDRSKAEYDKSAAAVTPMAVAHPAGDVVRVPNVSMRCTGMICAPTTHYEELKFAKVKQAPNEAIQRELDKKHEQVTAQSSQVVAIGKKVESLEPIDKAIRSVMAPLISLIVLAASLFVILSGGYKTEGERWAFGSLGTIIGFWLKG